MLACQLLWAAAYIQFVTVGTAVLRLPCSFQSSSSSPPPLKKAFLNSLPLERQEILGNLEIEAAMRPFGQ